jgi:hypothetical protein
MTEPATRSVDSCDSHRPKELSCAGDWVEVRSKEEILATLDASGKLEGMPFMPEMLDYCGKRFRVAKRAHKNCDPMNPISTRHLPNSVLLDNLRCNGLAHDGCQATCSIFWKQAWLKPSDGTQPRPGGANAQAGSLGCTEGDLVKATRQILPDGTIKYQCQATEFPHYTTRVRSHNFDQLLEDITSRNVGLAEFVRTMTFVVYERLTKPADRLLSRRIYDGFQRIWGGVPYPRLRGVHPDPKNAPLNPLNLQPSELVRVKPYHELLKTIGSDMTHRGMSFDAEMIPYCGGVFRVRSRVEQFIDERTGFMRRLKTPAVILENVWCRSHFSFGRLFCSRAIYAWWREAWLERATDATCETTKDALGARVILKPLHDPAKAESASGQK